MAIIRRIRPNNDSFNTEGIERESREGGSKEMQVEEPQLDSKGARDRGRKEPTTRYFNPINAYDL
jgi:hypothetical protein